MKAVVEPGSAELARQIQRVADRREEEIRSFSKKLSESLSEALEVAGRVLIPTLRRISEANFSTESVFRSDLTRVAHAGHQATAGNRKPDRRELSPVEKASRRRKRKAQGAARKLRAKKK